MQTDRFDQFPDLRLGALQLQRPSAAAQSPRQHRQINHQRAVGKRQVREVDNHVCLGFERSRERATAQALRRAILVSRADQDRRIVGKLDDVDNLYEYADVCQVSASELTTSN